LIKAHKIRLNPMPDQEPYFWRATGVARFTYNWALGRYNELRAMGQKPSLTKLKQEFNQIKGKRFPWVYEVSKTACEGAFMDLRAAFKNYLERQKAGALPKAKPGRKPRQDGQPLGYPHFKSKKKATPSFYIDNEKFKVKDHAAWIPLLGWVNMTESLRFEGKLMSARITYSTGSWWVSITVDVPHTPPQHNQEVVGIDRGVHKLATVSDGQEFENQKFLKRSLRQVKRLQRAVSRKQPGSKNYQQAVKRLARAHYRVACQRADYQHKMTTQLTRQYGVIGLEDLNVKGMMQNHHLAQAVSDAAMGELARQFQYKAAWAGGRVVYVDRWFASSKRCNACGWEKRDLQLGEREWHCSGCGRLLLRDPNAASNIEDEVRRLLAGQAEVPLPEGEMISVAAVATSRR
jgi:IS605 OrfB family transposase